MTKILF